MGRLLIIMRVSQRALLCAAMLLAGVYASPARAESGGTAKLVTILKGDSSFKLRANAARLLAKGQDPQAVTPLLDALRDENAIVRAAVCVALGSFDDGRIGAALKGMQSDSDEVVRKAARAALKQLEQAHTGNLAATGKRPHLYLRDIHASGKKQPDPLHEALQNAIRTELEGGGLPKLEIVDDIDRGYSLLGGAKCDEQPKGGELTIFCKINLVIARMPGKIVLGSVGVSGGATMSAKSTAQDRARSQRALFSALAKSLLDDFFSVVNQDRAQNGEEALR